MYISLPKPNLCDCPHFLHMRAPKPSSVTRNENRVPKTPDPCDSTHFSCTIHTRGGHQLSRPILVTMDTSQDKLLRHEGLKQGNCHDP